MTNACIKAYNIYNIKMFRPENYAHFRKKSVNSKINGNTDHESVKAFPFNHLV